MAAVAAAQLGGEGAGAAPAVVDSLEEPPSPVAPDASSGGPATADAAAAGAAGGAGRTGGFLAVCDECRAVVEADSGPAHLRQHRRQRQRLMAAACSPGAEPVSLGVERCGAEAPAGTAAAAIVAASSFYSGAASSSSGAASSSSGAAAQVEPLDEFLAELEDWQRDQDAQKVVGSGGRASSSAVAAIATLVKEVPDSEVAMHSEGAALAEGVGHAAASSAGGSRGDVGETVPCEVCGAAVPFQTYETHLLTHAGGSSGSSSSSSGPRPQKSFSNKKCAECGLQVPSGEYEDHRKAHALEKQLEKLDQCRAEQDLGDFTPESLAFRLVELLRVQGAGLPGHSRPQTAFKVGDQVNTLWNGDGFWYSAIVLKDNGDGTFKLAWAPPFSCWEALPRQRVEDIASLQGAETRDVVNFDVCVKFVRRMMALAEDTRLGVSFQPEVVFHWTPAQNHKSIIEDSLLVPGETSNALGRAVTVDNGEVLGRGIYTSTDPLFGAAFGVAEGPPHPDRRSSACTAVPSSPLSPAGDFHCLICHWPSSRPTAKAFPSGRHAAHVAGPGSL
mmetsp:Transcript_20758/g.58016  ORF Transcript_20758/g.58016 Transcript_20758/m.58016 type:complete len:559 (-) Transcript_20758:899-2575(-)